MNPAILAPFLTKSIVPLDLDYVKGVYRKNGGVTNNPLEIIGASHTQSGVCYEVLKDLVPEGPELAVGGLDSFIPTGVDVTINSPTQFAITSAGNRGVAIPIVVGETYTVTALGSTESTSFRICTILSLSPATYTEKLGTFGSVTFTATEPYLYLRASGLGTTTFTTLSVKMQAKSVQYFAANKPRIVPGKGLWARTAFTNLLTRSQSLAQDWSGGGYTISSDVGVAPDGSLTADKIIPSTVNENKYISESSAIVADSVYTESIFVKSDGYEWVQLTGSTGFAGSWQNFNIITGERGASSTAPGLNPSWTITALADGWFKLTFTTTSASMVRTGRLLVGILPSNIASRLPGWVGDGVSGVLAWQGQMVAGPQPGPPIRTTSAVASNGASVHTIPFVQKDEDFTMLVAFNMEEGSTGQVRYLACLAGVNNNDRAAIYIGANDVIGGSVASSAVSQGVGAFAPPPLASGRGVAAIRYRAGKFTMAAKAGNVATLIGPEGSAATFPVSLQSLLVGHRFSGGIQTDGLIERVRIVRKGLSDGDLEGEIEAMYARDTVPLDLNYRKGYYRRNGVTVRAPAALLGTTHVQSGSCYEVAPDGTLKAFGPNEPRVVPGLGLWARSSFTNLFQRSQELDNSYWVKLRATISADASSSPTGSIDADKLVETTAATNTHGVQKQAGPTITATTDRFTLSVFGKASERTKVRLYGLSVNGFRADFDLGVGSVIGSGSYFAGTPPTAALMTAGPNNWHYCTVTSGFLANNIGNVPLYGINLLNEANSESYTGDGVSGATLWQATLYAGSQRGPIIPTTGSTASNGASVHTVPFTQGDEDFVMLVAFNMAEGPTTIIRRLATLSGPSTVDRFGLSISASGAVSRDVQTASTAQADGSFSSGTVMSGRGVAALRYRGKKLSRASKLGSDAIVIGPDGSEITLPTGLSNLHIGSLNGGQHADMVVERVKIIRATLDDTQLAAAITEMSQ